MAHDSSANGGMGRVGAAPVRWLDAMVAHCRSAVSCFSVSNFSTNAPLDVVEEAARHGNPIGNKFLVQLGQAVTFWLEFDLDNVYAMPLCSDFGQCDAAGRPAMRLKHPYEYAMWHDVAAQPDTALTEFIRSLVHELIRKQVMPANTVPKPSQPAVAEQGLFAQDYQSAIGKQCTSECRCPLEVHKEIVSQSEARILVRLPIWGVGAHNKLYNERDPVPAGVPKCLPLVSPTADGVAVLCATYYWHSGRSTVKRALDIHLSPFLDQMLCSQPDVIAAVSQKLASNDVSLCYTVNFCCDKISRAVKACLRHLGYRLRAYDWILCILKQHNLEMAREQAGNVDTARGIYELSMDGLRLTKANNEAPHQQLIVTLPERYYMRSVEHAQSQCELTMQAFDTTNGAQSTPFMVEHDYTNVFLQPNAAVFDAFVKDLSSHARQCMGELNKT